jgi:hypothetical protein
LLVQLGIFGGWVATFFAFTALLQVEGRWARWAAGVLGRPSPQVDLLPEAGQGVE